MSLDTPGARPKARAFPKTDSPAASAVGLQSRSTPTCSAATPSLSPERVLARQVLLARVLCIGARYSPSASFVWTYLLQHPVRRARSPTHQSS